MKEPKVTVSKGSNGLIVLADIGVGGQRGMIYSTQGICPCQSATQYKDAIKVLVYGKKKQDPNLQGGCKLINLASSVDELQPRLELKDVSGTLLARDCRGLSNYGSNGVIEVWKK